MRLLLFSTIFAVCYAASSSYSELEPRLRKLMIYEDLSVEEKLEELSTLLTNFTSSEEEKLQITKNFKIDAEIISKNDKLIKNETFRIALLEVYAATNAQMLPFEFVDKGNVTSLRIERMDETIKYVENMDICKRDPALKQQLLSHFKESANRTIGYLYTIPFSHYYTPPSLIQTLFFELHPSEKKLEKATQTLGYRNANGYEKSLALKYYKAIINETENISQNVELAFFFLVQLREIRRQDQKRAKLILNRVEELLDNGTMTDLKKLQTFMAFAEELNSNDPDSRFSKMPQQQMQHYKMFFVLHIVTNKTMLEQLFESPILRKRLLTIFIAKESGDFSNFVFFDEVVDTYTRVAALSEINENIYDDLTDTEIYFIKDYFELYLEFDYVLHGIENKPYEKFCKFYLYTGQNQTIFESDEYSHSEKIDMVKNYFEMQKWVDAEELDLILQWYEEKLPNVEKEVEYERKHLEIFQNKANQSDSSSTPREDLFAELKANTPPIIYITDMD